MPIKQALSKGQLQRCALGGLSSRQGSLSARGADGKARPSYSSQKGQKRCACLSLPSHAGQSHVTMSTPHNSGLLAQLVRSLIFR